MLKFIVIYILILAIGIPIVLKFKGGTKGESANRPAVTKKKRRRKSSSVAKDDALDNSVATVQLRKQRIVTEQGLEDEILEEENNKEKEGPTPIELAGQGTEEVSTESDYDELEHDIFDLRFKSAGNYEGMFDLIEEEGEKDKQTSELYTVETANDFEKISTDETAVSESLDNNTENLAFIQKVSAEERQNRLIGRLRSLQDYLNRDEWDADLDDVEISYVSKDVSKVTMADEKLELRPYRVYVNGSYQPWDESAEVKVPSYTKADIEFGISLRIPEGYQAVVMPVPEMEDKYSLRFAAKKFVLNRADLCKAIFLRVTALDMGYISNTGVLFHMLIQKGNEA